MSGRLHLIVLVGATAIASCARGPDNTFQRVVAEQFAGQFHRCVPLGWNATAVDGSYVPAYSVQFSPRNVWLAPLWIGFVPSAALNGRQGTMAYEILNRLVANGMVTSERVGSGFRFYLTQRAFPYYFEDNDLGDNPLHLSYLCYSQIVPDRVVTNGLRASFTWHEGPAAPWADDPLLQSHSVILAPTRSPAVVTIAWRHGSWEVAAAGYDTSGALTSPLAWP